MTAADTKLWHTMSFADADKMIAWLTAIGFTEHATYRDEDDPSVVVHAEWLWPGAAGSCSAPARPTAPIDNVGRSAAYLVTDDPDARLRPRRRGRRDRRARDGRPGLRRPRRQRADPEGNHWSFGRLPAQAEPRLASLVARGSQGGAGRDPARRGRPRAHARAGRRDGARRDGRQRPRGRRLHLGDLHRDLRPGLGVPGVRRPPARLRRGARCCAPASSRSRGRCRGWCGCWPTSRPTCRAPTSPTSTCTARPRCARDLTRVRRRRTEPR